jgi:hypothetical protein
MKTIDFDKFKKMIQREGYTIGHTTKHHVVLTPEGDRLMRFAVLHGKGEKRQVLEVYVKRVMQAIAEDKARRQSKKGEGK